MRLRSFVLGTLLLLLTLALALPAQAGTSEVAQFQTIHLYIHDRQAPELPHGFLYGSTVVVPLRPLAKALGATLEWNAGTRTAVLTRGAHQVEMTLAEPRAIAGGVRVTLAQTPVELNGQPHVPLRFAAEALGYRVTWDGASHSVRLSIPPRVGGQATVADPNAVSSGLSPLYASSPNLLLQALYGEGLLTVGTDGRPVPALALSHHVSEDGLTYLFTIRKGIRFHDGTEVTAEDFAFTYSLLTHPDFSGPLTGWGHLAGARALDPYTLELTTTEPYGPFLSTVPTLPPLPRHLLKDVPVTGLTEAAFWKQPVGAGPFKAPRRESGAVVLERNPEFWLAAIDPAVGPWLEQLRFVAADPRQVVAGQSADVMSVRDARNLRVFGEAPPEGFSAYPWQRLGHGVVTFQHERWPTSIPEVRQALALAINWSTLAPILQPTRVQVAQGPLPAVHWAAAPHLRPVYDLPRAAALLEEAGFKRNARGQWEQNGQPLVIEFHASAGSTLSDAVATILQRDWQAFGVETRVVMAEFATMMSRFVGPGQFHAYLAGRDVGADPYEWLRSAWHSRNILVNPSGFNGGSNSARYRSPAFDELMDRTGATIDPVRRAELYRQAYAQLAADGAGIWIYHNSYTDYVRDRIQGVTAVDGFGVTSPERWYIAQP